MKKTYEKPNLSKAGRLTPSTGFRCASLEGALCEIKFDQNDG